MFIRLDFLGQAMPASRPSLENYIGLAKVANDLVPLCDFHPVKLGERLRPVYCDLLAFLGKHRYHARVLRRFADFIEDPFPDGSRRVPGRKIANHCNDSNPSGPDSATVGTSGNTPDRRVLVTATARRRAAFT